MRLNPIEKNNVTIINDGKEDTILFAHGFGTDQTAWTSVAEAFQRDYRIILYDNVGAGRSAPEAFSPNRYDNLNSYADDLLDICRELNIDHAIMVGHSVSGMISLLAAIKEPQRFRKLILVGASPRYMNDEGYLGGFSREALDSLFQAMDNNYYAWVSGFAPAAMANADRPQLAESFASSLSSIRPDIAQSVARVIFQADYRTALPKLETETLLLQTREDIAVPTEVAEYLHKHIKNSKLKIVNAEGHFPHISAPQEIIKAIKDFI